jgi:hypothetical protein
VSGDLIIFYRGKILTCANATLRFCPREDIDPDRIGRELRAEQARLSVLLGLEAQIAKVRAPKPGLAYECENIFDRVPVWHLRAQLA